MESLTYPYVWHWRSRLPDRKGQQCRVLCRGTMNSALVEFDDGYRAVVSRNALRRSLTKTERRRTDRQRPV